MPPRRSPIGIDAILLIALVVLRTRIDTYAYPLIPRPEEIVRRIPIVGGILSENAFDLLVDWMADPLSQLVIAASFGLVCLYLLLDLVQRRGEPARGIFWGKLAIIVAIGLIGVAGNTVMVMAMRALTTPAQFAHDGGVLMTDLAVRWLTEGVNVYTQDFRGTWVEQAYPNGPGLSHYPYLPFMFVPAVPVYLAVQSLWGWYDHRLIYLAAYAVILAVAPILASRPTDRLAVLAVLALNPIMTNEMIYGYNDVYVLAVVVVAIALYQRGRVTLGGIVLGCALATKGTVWPLLPFVVLYLWRGRRLDLRRGRRLDAGLIRPLVPIAVAALIWMLPFAIWNAPAMIEDTILYNGGSQVADGLPIKGWGAAQFVVALGLVPDLYAPFPFILLELVLAVPLFVLLIVRQWRSNTLAAALAHYSVFSFVFLYLSRTMNPNYLGFLISLLAVAFVLPSENLVDPPVETPAEPIAVAGRR